MKYRITPLLFFCALLTGLEIVFFAFPGSLENEPYGYQHIFLIPVIVVGLFLDFLLQKAIRRYSWLLLAEFALIAAAVLLNIRFW